MSPTLNKDKGQFSVQSDLEEYSMTQSVDEERLLQLYRNLSVEERSNILFRVTRLSFAPYFAIRFDPAQDRRDSSYLYEELEEAVLLAMPRECLAELRDSLLPIQFRSLFDTAWGSMAPVILGTSEQDGQHADNLFSVVQALLSKELSYIKSYDCDGNSRRFQFSRREALDVIERWREVVLQQVFKNEI